MVSESGTSGKPVLDREQSRSGLRGNGRSAHIESAWHTYTSFREGLLGHGRQPDPKVRQQVAIEIARRSDSQIIPQLHMALSDTDPLVRHTALLLVRSLFHRSQARHDIALRLALEDKEIIESVAGCLEDESQENIIAAYVALHIIWTPAAQHAIHQWRETCQRNCPD